MLPITDFQAFKQYSTLPTTTTQKETPSVHQVPAHKLAQIEEMDRKIGEFMQRRSEVVNAMVQEIARFQAGDRVLIKQGSYVIGTGHVVQAVFVKKLGVISYRIRKETGEDFTNSDFHLIKISE